jgi:hypothetical protein
MNCIFTFKQGRSRAIVAGVCSIVFVTSLSAQVTSVRLPTADSSASFQVQDSGNVVKMRLNGDGGFYAGGTYGKGVIPATGTGARMMWFPAKGAFRAGYTISGGWDSANIGKCSAALGSLNIASGDYTFAIGQGSVASGTGSAALGGYDSATGIASTTIGYGTKARADYSIAAGSYTTASGDYSTAMGYRTTASGNYSTAMGTYVSTNAFAGSFVIGDNSTLTTNVSTASNQMMMRFAGGYRLFTDAAATMGASLAPGGSSWGTISDSTKKTNFIKADHDYFLSSLSKLRLGSWNYKSQDAKNYRHYGPMAQEIFHYFGKDGKGTIGCDTLLASADMDGIMMICLQALDKRTSDLQKANEKIIALQSSCNELKTEMQQMKQDILLLAKAKSATISSIALNTKKGQ